MVKDAGRVVSKTTSSATTVERGIKRKRATNEAFVAENIGIAADTLDTVDPDGFVSEDEGPDSAPSEDIPGGESDAEEEDAESEVQECPDVALEIGQEDAVEPTVTQPIQAMPPKPAASEHPSVATTQRRRAIPPTFQVSPAAAHKAATRPTRCHHHVPEPDGLKMNRSPGSAAEPKRASLDENMKLLQQFGALVNDPVDYATAKRVTAEVVDQCLADFRVSCYFNFGVLVIFLY